MLIENPSVAGIDGKVGVMIFGQFLMLTPKKKKQD